MRPSRGRIRRTEERQTETPYEIPSKWRDRVSRPAAPVWADRYKAKGVLTPEAMSTFYWAGGHGVQAWTAPDGYQMIELDDGTLWQFDEAAKVWLMVQAAARRKPPFPA